jgi:RNA polymerase sigma-70 factor (ECF subfamily)
MVGRENFRKGPQVASRRARGAKTALPMPRNHQTSGRLDTTRLHWPARGDEASFSVFNQATNGLLFGLLLRILGHTQTAEEVLSELYEEVRERSARFGKQNEKPLTWLILMTHRRAIEHLCRNLTRRNKTLAGRGAASDTTNGGDTFINITEQRRLVRSALEAIPPVQQRMIELAFFAGMTNLQIANKLGLPSDAVEDGVRYAMLQLFSVFKAMDVQRELKTH